MNTTKVGVIGAGNVGAAIAYGLTLLQTCVTVVLFDRTLAKAEGEAWDIEDAIPMLSPMDVLPTDKYEDLADSDIIVITVGVPQKRGETRLDLLGKNVDIIYKTIEELDRVAPKAVVIIVSNPVDVLTRMAMVVSTRPKNLIIGSGTVLDTARLKYQLGKLLKVAQEDVNAYVLGEHGDSEFIAWSSAAIGLIPLNDFPLPPETSLEKIKTEYPEITRKRGYAISDRKGNTAYGVATAVIQIVDSILRNEKKIYTVSVTADPKYGIGNDVVLGLPCIIGKQGIERQLVLPLSPEEQRLLERSAAKLEKAHETLDS